jgi:hypothetical protein
MSKRSGVQFVVEGNSAALDLARFSRTSMIGEQLAQVVTAEMAIDLREEGVGANDAPDRLDASRSSIPWPGR